MQKLLTLSAFFLENNAVLDCDGVCKTSDNWNNDFTPKKWMCNNKCQDWEVPCNGKCPSAVNWNLSCNNICEYKLHQE